MEIREFEDDDLPRMMEIWNEVVEGGDAFPQEYGLGSIDEALDFFSSQSRTAVAVMDGAIVGLYILHPNNVGRCGHIANASYAVSSTQRGKHIGEALVRDSLRAAKDLGFRILQFNAVVASNERALRLYRSLGFHHLGTIPDGFRMKDGSYADIIPHWIALL